MGFPFLQHIFLAIFPEKTQESRPGGRLSDYWDKRSMSSRTIRWDFGSRAVSFVMEASSSRLAEVFCRTATFRTLGFSGAGSAGVGGNTGLGTTGGEGTSGGGVMGDAWDSTFRGRISVTGSLRTGAGSAETGTGMGRGTGGLIGMANPGDGVTGGVPGMENPWEGPDGIGLTGGAGTMGFTGGACGTGMTGGAAGAGGSTVVSNSPSAAGLPGI